MSVFSNCGELMVALSIGIEDVETHARRIMTDYRTAALLCPDPNTQEQVEAEASTRRGQTPESSPGACVDCNNSRPRWIVEKTAFILLQFVHGREMASWVLHLPLCAVLWAALRGPGSASQL